MKVRRWPVASWQLDLKARQCTCAIANEFHRRVDSLQLPQPVANIRTTLFLRIVSAEWVRRSMRLAESRWMRQDKWSRRVSELVRRLIRNQLPVFRLRVRVPCPPLSLARRNGLRRPAQIRLRRFTDL